MANNFRLVGNVQEATDDVNGVHYQKVKLIDATEDSETPIGTVANPLVVTGGGGDASAANQTNVQANAGSDASKVIAVQGVTSGKSVQVKGNDFSAQVDLTVDAGAGYAIGDAAGAAMTFAGAVSANGKRAIINTISITPNAAMPAVPFNLIFLNADLATPITKSNPFVMVAADAPKVLGCIPINASDYIPTQDNWNIATKSGVGFEFQAGAATTSIIGYLVTTATTNLVATHLYITLNIEFRD
jgi:hypothetical protein